MTGKEAWVLMLDWSSIVSFLQLDTFDEIPETKRERVIKKISKLYGQETLLTFKPSELDELVANELRELMKKEIATHAREREKLERQMKAKMAPFKNQGVMRIDMNEIKDMDPDELMKFFSNKIMGKKNDDDPDDDNDKYSEDKNSYYI
ncbi:MAG: hypothetical protein KGD70_10225 [Candidatus Lokiarchaeota archaeon]|nr:hypothetical protein [Candidatus Lokiarchaeota archaeon]